MNDFNYAAARISTAQICRAAGIERSVPSVLDIMTDLHLQHLHMISASAVKAAENRGSQDVDVNDVLLAAADCHVLHSKIDMNDPEVGGIADIVEMMRWLQGPDHMRQNFVSRPPRSFGQPQNHVFMPPGGFQQEFHPGMMPMPMNMNMPMNMQMQPMNMPMHMQQMQQIQMQQMPPQSMQFNSNASMPPQTMPSQPMPSQLDSKPDDATESRPDQLYDESKSGESKLDEVKPSESKSDDSKPDDSKSDDSKLDDSKPEESKSTVPRSEDSKPDDPDSISEAQINPGAPTPSQTIQQHGQQPAPGSLPMPGSFPPISGSFPPVPGSFPPGSLMPVPGSSHTASSLPGSQPVPMFSQMQDLPTFDAVERDWLKAAINRQILMGHRDWFVNTELGPRTEPDTKIHGN